MYRTLSLAFLLSSGRSHSANPTPASSTERQQRGASGWRRWVDAEMTRAKPGRSRDETSVILTAAIHQPGLCSQGSGEVSRLSCRQAITFNSLTVKHTQEPGLFKDVVELAHILFYLVQGQRCMHKQNHVRRFSQGIHLYHWEVRSWSSCQPQPY